MPPDPADLVNRPWRVRLICCGRDDGEWRARTWNEAEEFRQSYTSGAGVAERPGQSGHERAGIIERVEPEAQATDPADLVNTILAATPTDRDEAYLTAFADVLRDHYLTEIVCDHERRQDNPVCSCSRAHLGWHQSVGDAVEAWIAHVFRHLPHIRAGRGDPRPVAARQAATTLRWLADNCPTVNGQTQVDGVWIWAELRELADQLDTQAIVDPTDRACPDRPRCIPVGTCTRHHCDRCGGHDPIRDKPGDFAVCRPCRAEMDADRPANQPNTVAEGDRP